MSRRVGVMGLGKMGGAFAHRLIEQGYETHGYDVNPAAIEQFKSVGGTAATPASLVGCDYIVTSLPSDDEVKQALTDEFLESVRGTTVVELSTILPTTMVALAERAARHGVDVIDAPVSGGFNQAREGTIVLLVGTQPEVLERSSGFLSTIGTVKYVGQVGNGKVVKLVNNMMSLGNVAVAVEAFALGVSLGMDGSELYSVLNESGGRSHNFTMRFPSVLERDFSARFALRLAEKDLRLALAMGHEHCYPMPIASSVHQLYEMATAKGLGAEDSIAVIKVYEGWTEGVNHG